MEPLAAFLALATGAIELATALVALVRETRKRPTSNGAIAKTRGAVVSTRRARPRGHCTTSERSNHHARTLLQAPPRVSRSTTAAIRRSIKRELIWAIDLVMPRSKLYMGI